MAQLVKCCPRVHKALDSIPSTTEIKHDSPRLTLKRWKQKDQKFEGQPGLGEIFLWGGRVSRQGFSVVMYGVSLELNSTDQAGLDITEIHLPLPGRGWN